MDGHRESSGRGDDREELPRVETPLTPNEHAEARDIARRMVQNQIDLSSDVMQEEMTLHAQTKRVGENAVVIALAELLDDPAPLTRAVAAIKLLQKNWGRRYAFRTLTDLMCGGDHETQLVAISFLSSITIIPRNVITAVEQLFQSGDDAIRVAAASVLPPSEKTLRLLEQSLDDEEPGLSVMAARGLIRHKVGIDQAVETLIHHMHHTAEIQLGVAACLCRLTQYADRIATEFMRLLRNPKTERNTRAVLIAGLGKLGWESSAREEFMRTLLDGLHCQDWELVCGSALALKEFGDAPKEALQALTELLSSAEPFARSTAAMILVEFGPLAKKVARNIYERMIIENDATTFVWLSRAAWEIGYPDGDLGFANEMIEAHIQAACRERNSELLAWRLGALASQGPRAIPSLIRLAQVGDIGEGKLAVSTLAMISTKWPEEVTTSVIQELLDHPSGGVRLLGVAVFAEMGSNAATAVPRLARLLNEDESGMIFDTLRALRGIGQAAHEAAPSVVRLLGNESHFHIGMAGDTLRSIGPDALPALSAALSSVEGDAKGRIEALINELETQAAQPASRDARARLDQLIPDVFTEKANITTLKRFYKIGEAYEIHGANSQRKVWNLLKDEMTLSSINKYCKHIIPELLGLVGEIFERTNKGDQQSISGLTEAGRMVWQLLGEIFKDVDW